MLKIFFGFLDNEYVFKMTQPYYRILVIFLIDVRCKSIGRKFDIKVMALGGIRCTRKS
jgi:hypothetical protein